MIKKKLDQEEGKFISNAFPYLFMYSFKDFRYVETFQKALSLPSAGFEKKISSSIKRECQIQRDALVTHSRAKIQPMIGKGSEGNCPSPFPLPFSFFLSSFLILFLFLTGRRVLDHVVSEI